MKFIVFSDSHGVSANMIRAVQLEKPDLCFYLAGDIHFVIGISQSFLLQFTLNGGRKFVFFQYALGGFFHPLLITDFMI